MAPIISVALFKKNFDDIVSDFSQQTYIFSS